MTHPGRQSASLSDSEPVAPILKRGSHPSAQARTAAPDVATRGAQTRRFGVIRDATVTQKGRESVMHPIREKLVAQEREIRSLQALVARLQPKADSLERIFRAADYGDEALWEQITREEETK